MRRKSIAATGLRRYYNSVCDALAYDMHNRSANRQGELILRYKRLASISTHAFKSHMPEMSQAGFDRGVRCLDRLLRKGGIFTENTSGSEETDYNGIPANAYFVSAVNGCRAIASAIRQNIDRIEAWDADAPGDARLNISIDMADLRSDSFAYDLFNDKFFDRGYVSEGYAFDRENSAIRPFVSGTTIVTIGKATHPGYPRFGVVTAFGPCDGDYRSDIFAGSDHLDILKATPFYAGCGENDKKTLEGMLSNGLDFGNDNNAKRSVFADLSAIAAGSGLDSDNSLQLCE